MALDKRISRHKTRKMMGMCDEGSQILIGDADRDSASPPDRISGGRKRKSVVLWTRPKRKLHRYRDEERRQLSQFPARSCREPRVWEWRVR